MPFSIADLYNVGAGFPAYTGPGGVGAPGSSPVLFNPMFSGLPGFQKPFVDPNPIRSPGTAPRNVTPPSPVQTQGVGSRPFPQQNAVNNRTVLNPTEFNTNLGTNSEVNPNFRPGTFFSQAPRNAGAVAPAPQAAGVPGLQAPQIPGTNLPPQAPQALQGNPFAALAAMQQPQPGPPQGPPPGLIPGQPIQVPSLGDLLFGVQRRNG